MASFDSALERLDDIALQGKFRVRYDRDTSSLQEILSSCGPDYLLNLVASCLRQETDFFEDGEAMDKVIQVFSNNMKYYKKNETLKKQCLSPRNSREFDLIQPPQTLTELFVLVDFAQGHRIWLENGSFIQGVEDDDSDDAFYFLNCDGSRYSKLEYNLSFGGPTRDGAKQGLELAVGLHDEKCTEVELRGSRGELADRICPLNGIHLHNFLNRNHGCKRYFADISFSDDQCTILAVSMLNSSDPVSLSHCSLSDGGAAFATSFRTNAATRNREAKVDLELTYGDLPFDTDNWLLFNNSLPDTSCLEFLEVAFEDGIECLAPTVASLSITDTDFPYVLPPDNSGPMRIKFEVDGSLQDGFRSPEKAVSFFSALESNSRLQFLELKCVMRDKDSLLDLIPRSLSRNTCLRELRLFMPFRYDHRLFRALFQSLRNHPSLLSFHMKLPRYVWYYNETPSREEKEATTQCVTELLDSNHCIEEFELQPVFVNECAWETRVTPRLRSNVYRKKLAEFDEIESDHMRAALASDLMGSVSKSPYLLWFALQRSRSTIVSSLLDLEPLDPVDGQGTTRLPGRGTKRNWSKLRVP